MEVLCADELRGFTPAIKKIAESQKMKYLVLRNSEIGLEQMQTLSKCHSIRSLDIKENQEVTDECIAFVPKAVRNLCIIGCSITPKCIPALTKLKDLQSLQISLNGWSNEDLQRLRNALPETVIRP
ncbi:MAG: hypothetical protein IT343_11130 [Candidatus Melainabacteria bacterium]|nr:hypothetical protein [Candidatus Melainabacteria bacterium]